MENERRHRLAELRERMNAGQARLLVLDPDPAQGLEEVRTQWGDLLTTCRRSDDIEAAVRAVNPDVAFLFRLPGVASPQLEAVTAGENLAWLHVGGAGVDHVPAWQNRSVTVTNAAGVLSQQNAEYAMAAMLMANIGFPRYFHAQHAGRWEPFNWVSLSDQTLLLLGVGHIGSHVARLSKSFGMRVIGVTSSGHPAPDVDRPVALADLDDLLPEADFVILCLPLTPATRGLFGTERLALLKPGAVLINLARGGLVDEVALARVLRSGSLRAAVLDVFEAEPLAEESPLWGIENLIVTPHISGAATAWKREICRGFMLACDKIRQGLAPPNVVDPDRGY